MAAQLTFFERASLAARQGFGAPILLLALLGMVVLPLPTPLLDALFTFNIALSLVVLLAVIYIRRPLDFTIFPSVLLVATLLRLALNVASTRVVLLNGHEGTHAAGQVIAAFGDFVIGGNYAVGIVVFGILTIINFVVITKGAGRISEVSARFTLDALPGKQMAIDADLNAGLLSRDEAKARREEVREEADFYGSMDGASKFVRGDAIAGILILFINLIGGLLIGVLQHDLSFTQAAQVYALLTIGDGLVAQIPALLISTGVAMLVTRISRPQDLAETVVKQMLGSERALNVAAVIMVVIGLIPGMPNVPFLLLGAALAYAGWRLHQRNELLRQEALAPPPPDPSKPAVPELSWDDLAPVDPLGIEVGYRLVPLVERKNGGELLNRIKGVRKKLTQDVGFLIPPVHIRDNLELPPASYRILIHGSAVASGDIHPDREMALDPGQVFGKPDGIPAKDPAFGLDAIWIQPAQRAEAEGLGYTVVDPSTVIATHLSHLVREHSHELLGHEEVQQLLQTLGRNAPKLVEELTPRALPVATIARVLQNLLMERVPIRHFKRIAEALVEHAQTSTDANDLTAAARAALGRFIVQEINGLASELPVYTLAPSLERILQESVSGSSTALEPGLADRLNQNLADVVKRQEALGQPAVLLVPGPVRPVLSRLVRHSVPQLSVLAYHEIPDDKRLKLIGQVG